MSLAKHTGPLPYDMRIQSGKANISNKDGERTNLNFSKYNVIYIFVLINFHMCINTSTDSVPSII